jgi:hypothetical protein
LHQFQHVTKKLKAPTKRPKMLICYDFHFGISGEEKDMMFTTKLRLFSIGAIVVLILVKLKQHVKLITSANLNLIKQVYVPIELVFVLSIFSDIPVKPVFVLHVLYSLILSNNNY